MGRSALEGMPPPPRTRDGRPSCNRAAMGVSGMQGSLGMDNKEEEGVSGRASRLPIPPRDPKHPASRARDAVLTKCYRASILIAVLLAMAAADARGPWRRQPIPQARSTARRAHPAGGTRARPDPRSMAQARSLGGERRTRPLEPWLLITVGDLDAIVTACAHAIPARPAALVVPGGPLPRSRPGRPDAGWLRHV
jgi:hypothetical protein